MSIADMPWLPSEVFAYYSKRGSGKDVTTAVLQNMIGTDTIPLPKHDIYVMGKRLGSRVPVYFTKLRIETKASERNTVQGLLGVRFLAGHGYDKWVQQGGSTNVTIMRPADIKKLVTEDTGSFKKRAVIDLSGHLVSLSLADGFCRIPLMDHRLLADFEKATNSKKREAYALKKKVGNEWAHINRNSMLAENKKAMHRMILPYKKNLRDQEYFEEFMKDMVNGCLQLRREFCPNADDNTAKILKFFNYDSGKDDKDVDSEEPKQKKRRIVDKVSHNLDTTGLKTIPSSEVSW